MTQLDSSLQPILLSQDDASFGEGTNTVPIADVDSLLRRHGFSPEGVDVLDMKPAYEISALLPERLLGNGSLPDGQPGSDLMPELDLISLKIKEEEIFLGVKRSAPYSAFLLQLGENKGLLHECNQSLYTSATDSFVLQEKLPGYSKGTILGYALSYEFPDRKEFHKLPERSSFDGLTEFLARLRSGLDNLSFQ